MRRLKYLICKIIGHEPIYYQAKLKEDGEFYWGRDARCTRCSCPDSVAIHTPGLLDFRAWFVIGADSLRFTLTEWHRGKRRALRRLFRKRTSDCP